MPICLLGKIFANFEQPRFLAPFLQKNLLWWKWIHSFWLKTMWKWPKIPSNQPKNGLSLTWHEVAHVLCQIPNNQKCGISSLNGGSNKLQRKLQKFWRRLLLTSSNKHPLCWFHLKSRLSCCSSHFITFWHDPTVTRVPTVRKKFNG